MQLKVCRVFAQDIQQVATWQNAIVVQQHLYIVYVELH